MTAVGASLPRKDAFDKLKGVAKYIDDYNFSDLVQIGRASCRERV